MIGDTLRFGDVFVPHFQRRVNLLRKFAWTGVEERNGEPAGARTQDQRLKRAMLYQLSYRLIPFTKLTQTDRPPRRTQQGVRHAELFRLHR